MIETALISFCTKSHSDVWKLTSRGLINYVKADRFIVFVPDAEVNFFSEITDRKIEVISEKNLPSAFYLQLKKSVELANNSSRFNWYYQQFIKIESLIEIASNNLIIWDADCVPVKNLNFFTADGLPKYIMSDEFHADYFFSLEKLLGLKKLNSKSYIAPGFPITKKWVNEFVDEVEKYNHGQKWHQAIISTTDFTKASGFSEFETLGTWVEANHKNEIKVFNCNWERFGQSKIGYAKNLEFSDVANFAKSKNLDVISFENWDSRGFKKYSKLFLSLILKLGSFIKNRFNG